MEHTNIIVSHLIGGCEAETSILIPSKIENQNTYNERGEVIEPDYVDIWLKQNGIYCTDWWKQN